MDGIWWPVTDKREIPFWPYCQTCETPYDFSPDEPFASCKCGTCEWGYPRPAAFVKDPSKV